MQNINIETLIYFTLLLYSFYGKQKDLPFSTPLVVMWKVCIF